MLPKSKELSQAARYLHTHSAVKLVEDEESVVPLDVDDLATQDIFVELLETMTKFNERLARIESSVDKLVQALPGPPI